MEHHFPVVHFENENRNKDIILTLVKSNKSRQSTLLKHSGLSDHVLYRSSAKITNQGGGHSNDNNKLTSILIEKGVIQEQYSKLLNDVPISNTNNNSKQEPVISIVEPLPKQDPKIMKADTKPNQQQGPSKIDTTVQQDKEKQTQDSTLKFFLRKRMSTKKFSSIFQALSKKTSKNASQKHIEHCNSQSITKDGSKADVEILYACRSKNFSSKTMKGKKRSAKSSFGDSFNFGKNFHRLDEKMYTLFHKVKKNKELSKPLQGATPLLGDNNIDVPATLIQQINASIPKCMASLSATNAEVVHRINSAIPHLSDNQDNSHINHPQFHAFIPNNKFIMHMNTQDVNTKTSSRIWFSYDKRQTRLHGNKSNSALRTQVSTPLGERRKRRFRKRSKLRQSQTKYVKTNVSGIREKSTTNSDSQIRSRFLENQVHSLFKFNRNNQENLAVSPVCNLLEIESRYKATKLRKTKNPSLGTSIVYPIQAKTLCKVTVPTHSRQNLPHSDRNSDLSSLSIDQKYAILGKENSRANVWNTEFDHGDKTSRHYSRREFMHKKNSPVPFSSIKPSARAASKIVEHKNKKRSKSCLPHITHKLEKDKLKLSNVNLPSTLKKSFGKALQIKDHESKKYESNQNYSNKRIFSSSDFFNTEHFLDSTEGICNTNNIQNKASPVTKRKKSTLLWFCLPENNKYEVLTTDKRAHKSNINKKLALTRENNEMCHKEKALFGNDRTINTFHLQRSMLEKKPDLKQNRAAPEKKYKIKANKSGKLYIQRKKNLAEYDLGLHPKDAKSYQLTASTKNMQGSFNVKERFNLPTEQFAYNTRVCQVEKYTQQSIVDNLKKRNEMNVPVTYRKKAIEKGKQKCKQPNRSSTVYYIQRKSKPEITDLGVTPQNDESKRRKNHRGIKYFQKREAIETRFIDTESQKTITADTHKHKQYYPPRPCQSLVKYIQTKDETLKIANNVIPEHHRKGTKIFVDNQHQEHESNTAKYKHFKDKMYEPQLNVKNLNGDFIYKAEKYDNQSDRNKLMYCTSGRYFPDHNTLGVYTAKSETSIRNLRKLKHDNKQKLKSRRVQYVQRKYMFTDIGLHVKGMENSKDPTYKNKSKYEISQLKTMKELQEQKHAQLPRPGSNLLHDKAKKYINPSSSVIYIQNKAFVDDTLSKQKSFKYIETPEKKTNRRNEVKYLQRKAKSGPLDFQENKQKKNNQEKHLGRRLTSDSKHCVASYEKSKNNFTKTLLSHKTAEIATPCSKISTFQKLKQIFLFRYKRDKLRTAEKKELLFFPLQKEGYNSLNKKDQGVQFICARLTSPETQDSMPKSSKCMIGQQSGKTHSVIRKSIKKKDKSHKTQDRTPKTSTCNFGQPSGKTQCVQRKLVNKKAKKKDKSYETQDRTPKTSTCNFGQQSGETQCVQRKSANKNAKKKDKSHETQDRTPQTSICDCGQQSGETQCVQRKSANKNAKKKDKSHKTQERTPKSSTSNFGQQSRKTPSFQGKYYKNEATTIRSPLKKSKRKTKCLNPSLKTKYIPKKSSKFKSKTKAKGSCTRSASKNTLKENKKFLIEKRKFIRKKQKFLKKIKQKKIKQAESIKPCKSKLISLSSTKDKSGGREIVISGRTNLVEKILKFMTAKSVRAPNKQQQTTVILKTLKSSHTQNPSAADKINICDTPKNIKKILETMDDAILDTKYNNGDNNQDVQKYETFTCDTVENSEFMPIVRGQKELKISGPPKQVKKLLKILCVTRRNKFTNLQNKVTISLPGSGNIQVCGHRKNVTKMVELLGLKKRKSSMDCLVAQSGSKHKEMKEKIQQNKKDKCQKKIKEKSQKKIKADCQKKIKEESRKRIKEECQKINKEKSRKETKEQCQRNIKIKKPKKIKEKCQKKIKVTCQKRIKAKCQQKVKEKSQKKKKKDCQKIEDSCPKNCKEKSQDQIKGENNDQMKENKDQMKEKKDQMKENKDQMKENSHNKKSKKKSRKPCSTAPIEVAKSIKPCDVTPCQTGSQVSASSMLESDSFKDKRDHQELNVPTPNKPIFPNTSLQLYIASTDNKSAEIFIQPLEIDTTARKKSKKFNISIRANIYKKGKVMCKQICIPAEEIIISGKPGCPAYTRVYVKPKDFKKIKKNTFCNTQVCCEDKKKKKKELKVRDACLKSTRRIEHKRRKERIRPKIRGRKLSRSSTRQATTCKLRTIPLGDVSMKDTCTEFRNNIGSMCLLGCTGCLWLPLICCYRLYCCISS